MVNALPTLFILATVLGITGSFFDTAWLKGVCTFLLVLLGGWAAVLKWGSSFLNSLGINAESTVEDEKADLNQIRSELSQLLANRNSPLLIVMDDLDRLTTEQLRMSFQLVKANLEFPNVVFLLLFQRDLVENKLTDGKQHGRDYLQKIIQVPFDIPQIEIGKLQSLLFDKLDLLLEQDKTAQEMFDASRWGNLFHGALHAYFDNLRNVYRYTSTLAFHFGLFKGKSVFEVNPVDLMGIECIRVFEPDVYKEIARAKDIFSKNGSDSYGTRKKEIAAFVNDVVDKANKRKFTKELISQLFPTIEWALEGGNYDAGFGNIWLREMRVCHPSNFDKYFQFSIPTGEISNSDLRKMLSITADAQDLSTYILSLIERGVVKNALSQFEAFSDQIPLENGGSFIKGLLDIGDQLDHEAQGFTIFSSNTHVTRLIVWFLRRIDNLDERGKLLLECFESSQGLSIVESILVADENRRKKGDPGILIPDSYFERLKGEFVKKLDKMSEDTTHELITNDHLVSFLYRWKRWGNEEKVNFWIKTQIDSVDGCINLLKAFLSKSSSQTVGDHVVKLISYIRLESIEDFVDTNYIREKLNGVDETSLDSKAKEAINAFKDALNRREKGIVEAW